MRRKIYQSLDYIDLDTYVNVNGQRTLIQFRGGSLKPRANGKYIATDPAIIKALDAAGGLNKDFKCILIDDVPDQKKEPVNQTVKAAPAPATEDPDPPEPTDKDEERPEKPPQSVTGITNVQEAREWLLKNFPDVKASQLPNGKEVKKVALMYGVEFTDLP